VKTEVFDVPTLSAELMKADPEEWMTVIQTNVFGGNFFYNSKSSIFN
jgi:hypothetical protein